VALLVPTAPLWVWAQHILVALGQPAELAALAQLYMRLLLPSLLPFTAFEVARKFCYAQGLQWPPLPAACIGLASHVLWLEALVWLLGASGAALAPCLSYGTMALLLVGIVRWRLPSSAAAWPRGKRGAWPPHLRDWAGWRRFLRLTVASLLSLTEWLFWETVCLRVASLGVVPLAAYSVG